MGEGIIDIESGGDTKREGHRMHAPKEKRDMEPNETYRGLS